MNTEHYIIWKNLTVLKFLRTGPLFILQETHKQRTGCQAWLTRPSKNTEHSATNREWTPYFRCRALNGRDNDEEETVTAFSIERSRSTQASKQQSSSSQPRHATSPSAALLLLWLVAHFPFHNEKINNGQVKCARNSSVCSLHKQNQSFIFSSKNLFPKYIYKLIELNQTL